MTSHSHKITVEAPKQQVYEAITTARGLQGWYTASVQGAAGHGERIQLDFESKAGPFHWKVDEIDPGTVVRWECVEGPGNSRGTTATFRLVEADGKTSVELDHDGIDETDPKRSTCNSMWGALMLHLKRFIETGKTDPAFV